LERHRAEPERHRADQERQRAEMERQQRLATEAELERLRRLLAQTHAGQTGPPRKGT
jgi:hypothetical protein